MINTRLTRTIVLAVVSAFSGIAAAEPSLSNILQAAGHWTLLPSTDEVTRQWAIAPNSTVDVTLLAEATGWANQQTFSFIEGATTVTVFEGIDGSGSHKRERLDGPLLGVMFASNSGDPQQFAPGGLRGDIKAYRSLDAADLYALAYEDNVTGATPDYNDMVVTVRVDAIPEPSTWALVLAGLGFGLLLSRRHAQRR